ncbi:hypothetical protein WA026_022336 [Henosepilachna vigintioctopunctata]
MLGVDHGYTTVPNDRSHLLKYVPNIKDLPPRNIKDSFLEGIIPLSKDEDLRDKYVTFMGHVRIGRLLEDMDKFAVHVGLQHIHAPTVPKDIPIPFMLATARCDRIDITSFERKPNEDIKIAGFVSWVGRSSMEVVVWLDQHYQGTWNKITRAIFLLAARNATGTQAVAVNPLNPGNEYETKIVKDGEERKSKRVTIIQSRVSKVIPTTEEQQLIHVLYEKQMTEIRKGYNDKKMFPRGVIAMSKCRAANIIFNQPENRNYFNKVFGGFIMRHATEIAWVLGFKVIRQRPSITHISDIDFISPIAVDALMYMRARIVYTQENFAQIIVAVFSLEPTKGVETRSNTFHFTVTFPDPIKQVYPITYHEAMLYVDGKRHFDSLSKSNEAESDDVLYKYLMELSKNER